EQPGVENLMLSFARTTALLTIVFSLLFTSLASQAALPISNGEGEKLPSLAPMLERVTPAVVNIATTGTVQVQNPLFNDPFFRHFFDVPNAPRQRQTQSLGSGVVVDAKNGYILTNNHVIDHADEIHVTLRNGETHSAKLVGTDPETDVAVIQIEAKDLTAVPISDSDQIRVGDFVVAIGNPFGLGQTVTSGIVSAVGRSGLGIEGYEDFIQTDASINPGNSGGALVNLRGELVGINTAILSQSGGNIGIGFAIPIKMAHDIMQQILKHGKVERGRLGAQAQDLTKELAQAFGIKYRRGAVVTQVTPKSAADKSGLRAGDIVTEVNGKAVRDADTLRNSIGLLRVGEEVTLKVLREGKPLTLTARVEKPDEASEQLGKNIHPQLDGAQLTNLEENNRMSSGLKGVLIAEVEPGTRAWRNGLRKGDIIVSANRKAVESVGDLNSIIKGSQTLLLNIRRGNGALFLYLK
ncbi:DegQ family serine endoprotease, partial [Kaarinaea lacus]